MVIFLNTQFCSNQASSVGVLLNFTILFLLYYSQPRIIVNFHVSENVHGGRKKPRKLKIQKQSEERIIKNMRNLFSMKNKDQSKTE